VVFFFFEKKRRQLKTILIEQRFFLRILRRVCVKR